jgi:TrmH family RNA methyltransferase
MQKSISSVHNPLIKKIIQLQEKSRERKKTGLFVVEGLREIEMAIKGNYIIETLLFCEEIISEENLKPVLLADIEIIKISNDVYQKISYRTSTEGAIAIVKSKNHCLDDLKFNNSNTNHTHPLILVMEAPEKPGNIGAALRTADAAMLDAVIIANPKTDIYNPNIIRSSVGCVFTNQIATASTSEIISFLKKHQISILSAALEESVDYDSCDYTKSTAIVVGTEASGLSNEWLENSAKKIVIPMRGEIDSMNVSVAAGILIFEAIRQRK